MQDAHTSYGDAGALQRTTAAQDAHTSYGGAGALQQLAVTAGGAPAHILTTGGLVF